MDNIQNFNPNYLMSIGFNANEIKFLMNMLSSGLKINSNTMTQLGVEYKQQQRLKYMYNICCGKANINTKEEVIKHLKKLNNHEYKIGIQDLAVSKINTVPRIAVVANIKEEPYTIWNSNNYKGRDALYLVKDVTRKNIIVETSRKPQLTKNMSTKIEDVLEIKGVRANGKAVIAFDKSVCRLCNRFIILATLRHPEFHHGMYEIICSEGTKIYVYAKTMGVREGVKYNGNTERIYTYGFFPNEIPVKLKNVAGAIYKQLHGVSSEYNGANAEYLVLDKVRKDTELEDESSL